MVTSFVVVVGKLSNSITTSLFNVNLAKTQSEVSMDEALTKHDREIHHRIPSE